MRIELGAVWDGPEPAGEEGVALMRDVLELADSAGLGEIGMSDDRKLLSLQIARLSRQVFIRRGLPLVRRTLTGWRCGEDYVTEAWLRALPPSQAAEPYTVAASVWLQAGFFSLARPSSGGETTPTD